MKKILRISSLMMLALASGFISCKKENTKPTKDGSEQMYAVKINMASSNGNTETGIIIGTKEELDNALQNKEVQLKKTSQANNVFQLAPSPVNPSDPVDNVKLCWDEINSYYESHYTEWLNWANQNCQDYTACLTCPKAGVGLYALYVIKPTSIRCTQVAPMNYLAFQFSLKELDSKSVGEFIANLK